MISNILPTPRKLNFCLITCLIILISLLSIKSVVAEAAALPLKVSATYPSLAMFGDPANAEPSCCNETGIGALVNWAGKLWTVTYPPHQWNGSLDFLYSIDPKTLLMNKYHGSVGGTTAARMIHKGFSEEDKTQGAQLIIGPYFIDEAGNVRVIPPAKMPGRLTAVTYSIKDPLHKVYFYTMEQGLYEVDVKTLAVSELHKDANQEAGQNSNKILSPIIPGAHGKSAYSGQNRLVIANNGWGGALAEWDGKGDPSQANAWKVIENKKFTDITGPGGINGSPSSDSPLWAIGWDNNSTILKLLDHGEWYTYRLPKPTHTFDDNNGWLTEWPRIHRLNNNSYIMDMYGMFYSFPGTFSKGNSAGIRPISAHLAIINDIIELNGQLVMAANDTLWSPFYNPSVVKPNSNLRFLTRDELNSFGKPFASGGPWVNQKVYANQPSEPFLLAGFEKRVFHFAYDGDEPVEFRMEVDDNGSGNWRTYQSIVPSGGYGYFVVPADLQAEWIRFKASRDVNKATIYAYYDSSKGPAKADLFKSLASVEQTGTRSEGIIRPKDETLQYVAYTIDGSGNKTAPLYYEIDENLKINKINNPGEANDIITKFGAANKGFEEDEGSVIITDYDGRKYRLPKNSAFNSHPEIIGWPRSEREVVVDRYLMNVSGAFYEVPYPESGGMRKIKPIIAHNKLIYDMASWRGMLILSGALNNSLTDGHYFKSDDGNAGLWFGNVDDLWQLGSPSGSGGPWTKTQIGANQYSDPYLMAGYVNKTVELSHSLNQTVSFTIEVDITGDGDWKVYNSIPFNVPPGQIFIHKFPDGFEAWWVRLKTNVAASATAKFIYSSLSDSFSAGRFCTPTDWTPRQDFPELNQPYRSYDHVVLPDGRLKQSTLASDGKSLFVRYLSWNSATNSWENPTNWTNTVADLPDQSKTYWSYDQVMFPDQRLKQTALADDGKTLYWRYLTWDSPNKKWADIGEWINRGSIDLPNQTEQFRSFDQVVLAGNQIKQSALSMNGKRLYYRYLNWDDLSKSWINVSVWYIKSIDFSDPNAQFSGIDSVIFPDQKLKETLVSLDGKTLYWRYLVWNPSGTACVSTQSSPSPNLTSSQSAEYTVSYKIAELPTDLDSALAQPYESEPKKITYTFKNTQPGDKYLWVRFITNKGSTKDYSAKIKLTIAITPSSAAGSLPPNTPSPFQITPTITSSIAMYCQPTSWELRQQDLPVSGQPYRSYDHVVLPDGRLKQSTLASDGKSLFVRYLSWNSQTNSWGNVTAWEESSKDLPDQSKTYWSYDQVMFPDQRLKQTVLVDDGKTLIQRYLTWDRAGNRWSNIGNWENSGGGSLPNQTEQFRSFDQVVLPDKKIKQSALSIDGKKLSYRYLNWDDSTKSWIKETDWLAESLKSPDATKQYLGYDSAVFPDNRLKETLLTADGKALYRRYLTWNENSQACLAF